MPRLLAWALGTGVTYKQTPFHGSVLKRAQRRQYLQYTQMRYKEDLRERIHSLAPV